LVKGGKLVSFLSNLFNKKEQIRYPEESKKSADLSESEEEYPEDEEMEESAEEDKLSIDTYGKDSTLEEHNDTDVEEEIVEREILPAKIICPDCGGITLEGLEFCDKCGGEL
jgi:hypothetical protein